MPNTVRLHRVLAMKREKVYRAFIEPDPMVPTWQPGHFQAAPLWQPVGRSGLTVLSNVRCRQLRCVAALGRMAPFGYAVLPPNLTFVPRYERSPKIDQFAVGVINAAGPGRLLSAPRRPRISVPRT